MITAHIVQEMTEWGWDKPVHKIRWNEDENAKQDKKRQVLEKKNGSIMPGGYDVGRFFRKCGGLCY